MFVAILISTKFNIFEKREFETQNEMVNHARTLTMYLNVLA